MTIQTYDPTIEDAYRKQAMVDERMCFIEVIDTAGQGEPTHPRALSCPTRSRPVIFAIQRSTPLSETNGSGAAIRLNN